MLQNRKNVILKATNLKKSFYYPKKIQILKQIDLSVHSGETVAIMGRSGEGKSTLLQILGTLDTACEGRLEIVNQQITTFNTNRIRNKNVAFIFQSFHLLEDYTALENVLMPARIAREHIAIGSPIYNRCLNLLDHVGLKERAHFHTKLLSGGEKQRVAIARALCNDPDIILADEPSGNLDRQTAHHIHELLLNFSKVDGKTIILVTHDQKLADLCDRTLHLQDGCLQSPTP